MRRIITEENSFNGLLMNGMKRRFSKTTWFSIAEFKKWLNEFMYKNAYTDVSKYISNYIKKMSDNNKNIQQLLSHYVGAFSSHAFISDNEALKFLDSLCDNGLLEKRTNIQNKLYSKYRFYDEEND